MPIVLTFEGVLCGVWSFQSCGLGEILGMVPLLMDSLAGFILGGYPKFWGVGINYSNLIGP